MTDEPKNPEENPQDQEPEMTPEPTPEAEAETPETGSEGDEGLDPEKQRQLQAIEDSVGRLRDEIAKVIVGQTEMVELMLASLLAGGHVLLEGVPGIAKTLAARLMAKTLSVDFSRIQFTPDLMPSDVVGTSVYNMKDGEFIFKQGPVFSNVVLIDEINRAPAKTQAALFEVMEERQVTVDGHTYPMEFPFIVLATQNPIEQEGTYKLPEAQLDRFLFRIKMQYPSLEEESAILMRFRDAFDLASFVDKVRAVFSMQDIQQCQSIVEHIHMEDALIKYIAEMIHKTRNHPDIYLGASPRASLAIMRTAKAVAAMAGRAFVTPEDIQYVAYPVLNHRIMLSSEKELEGAQPEDVIKDIIQTVEVPR